MARINFEDDVEAQDEFSTLLTLLGGDRDRVLGKLVRFFRIAQKAYGYDEPMSDEDLRLKDFGDMIQSGWAVRVKGGFQALGAEKHFAWYRQSVQRAIKGGQANKKRIEQASYPSGSIPASPPSPAPAPAPVQKQEEERNDVFDLLKVWAETLSHFGIETMPAQSDMAMLRILKRYKSRADVERALIGQRHEKDNPPFVVREHLSLHRLLDSPKHFEKMTLLGAGSDKKVWVTAREEQEGKDAV